MTSPSVVRDLLIKLPSLSRSPSAPVLDTLSLPAKSTKLILETFSVPDCKTGLIGLIGEVSDCCYTELTCDAGSNSV